MASEDTLERRVQLLQAEIKDTYDDLRAVVIQWGILCCMGLSFLFLALFFSEALFAVALLVGILAAIWEYRRSILRDHLLDLQRGLKVLLNARDQQ